MKRKARFDELEAMVKAAELYYISGLNQGEIAKILGVSRQKAFRLIKKARELGLVEIKIRRPAEADQALAQKIKEKYSLEDVVVARVYSEVPENVIKAIAQAGADYIKGKLVPYISVGVAYGRTLYEVIRYLPRLELPGVRVVQMMGAYGGVKWKTLAIELLKNFADKLGGEAVYLFAPAFAGNSAIREAFLKEVGVRETLRMAEEVDVALVGIGGIRSETSLLIETGDLREEEIRELTEKGAVGGICGNFFDIRGCLLDVSFNARRISVRLERLKEGNRKVIAIAGGKEKKEAILGALRGQWITTLVTDEATGRWLLEH
ncbi:MAG: hypothetical protein PWP60_54 [Candidatus Atribacteria bacterium]|uniref:sugar-binding transcriptional regulator n=1 Tax=Atrimonas thermophila TaxID=3064161 RepID=UPI0024AAE811|nr:hypothetical protein [Candidatus Atribacteria bacterium]